MFSRFILIFVCLIGGSGLARADEGQSRPGPPPGFVDIREIDPSIILDIRYYTGRNFVGARVDGYEAAKCYLTVQAARALAQVQAELLDSSLSLIIYDCYRPQSAVDHFLRWSKAPEDNRTKKEFYPTLNKKDLFKSGYIAKKSGHSRGSTVDLTIVALDSYQPDSFKPGQDQTACYLPAHLRFNDGSLDMGTAFDCFHSLSHTENSLVGAEQAANRRLLKNVMEKHGFVNYRREWWHFRLKKEPYPKTYFDFTIK